mgnify:CR=1 FL=1
MVRGVLYTGVTRARELLVVVGDDGALGRMAANDKQQRRYSGLRWRLRQGGGVLIEDAGGKPRLRRLRAGEGVVHQNLHHNGRRDAEQDQ